MVEQDNDRQTRLLADRLRPNPDAWNRALQYANAVQEHRGDEDPARCGGGSGE